jgi:thioredoxin
MKLKIFSIFFMLLLGFVACKSGPSQTGNTNLTPQAFADKIKATPNAQLVDVRTPEEFGKGHLNQALNIDWNGDNFEAEISKLDKTKPVFVYCLAGSRSAAAAEKMRSMGFKEVYELIGGIIKWRAENLPETTSSGNNDNGLNRVQFNKYLESDKLVLIDFYAEWCGPCKKMKPYLDEIALDMMANVEVIRINVDDNQKLCKELKIDALPVLQLYKGGNLVWSNVGYINKDDVLKHLS